MRFSEILKELRKQNGLTQEALANQLKVSKSTISMYENGERTPTMEAMIPIANFFGVDMNYLYGVSKPTEYNSNNDQLPSNVRPIKMQSLPIFKSPYIHSDMGFKIKTPNNSPFGNFSPIGHVSASHPIFADDTYGAFVADDATIPADFCLVAQDDSMIGARIQAGDVVFIRSQETVENKQIAAVIIDGVATLKRWHYYPDKAKLDLSPENSAYEPLVYVGDELNSVRCLGLAVCFMSNL
ncbi:MAG: helix-turn-helix domain-containing protein [Clostridia bacterium]|nr:helix-turn-helix domain-containing protein [Clostridia bacterium]